MPDITPAERLASLLNGENPLEIVKMRSGYAVMGDSQYHPGYCLLLAYPMVSKLNDLDGSARTAFLEDMALLGDAVLAATDAVRINYSIYGNLDPFLHAHVFPRYVDEEFATMPPMSIPADVRAAVPYDPAKHDDLRRAIGDFLRDTEPL